ncbi:MAG: ABC-2 family transporter protein [Paludisphaera borealis]|uniref:ABC transporter permease n=1 Tax=Paludisphaera borealis TaxID=1387353 RepID=UPI00283BB374|nr:ABC-2 family transporter protein [Paludisphaera borealis]MDR3621030.1 ABC-2 family transporter protein [Paludisphaera borealis]
MTPPEATTTTAPPLRNPADAELDAGPPHASGRRGVLGTIAKYAKIFRVSLIERMTYRGDFLFGTILRFLPIVTTILLWKAIYESSGQVELGGFHYREMIAYLLLTNISRMFSSMPGLAGGIAREVREGTLKRYLIQPLDLVGFLLSSRVAHKVAYITMSFLPYALLFYLCRGYFDAFPDAVTLAAYAVSLVLSFMVGFFFEVSVGMVGFWFLEVTSLLYIVMTLNFFISGHMLPLDLLPEPWSTLLKILPFQYMAYFPAVVFLGKIRGWQLVLHLGLELLWAVGFMALARVLYRAGLKRYSAYGG